MKAKAGFKSWALRLLPLALWCFQGLAGAGQWESLGPQGGTATAFLIRAQDSSQVLLGSPNGVFHSQDGGASWQRSSQGLSDPRVEALLADPADPERIWAATQSGVFLSLDGGSSWQASSQGLGDLFVEALAVDPSDTGVLYAATHDGVFKSIDGGAEWFESSQGIILDRRVVNVAHSPSQGQTVYAVTLQFGLYRSTDGGALWTRLSTGSRGYRGPLLIDPADDSVLVATAGGLFRSGNDQSWQMLSSLRNIQLLAFDPLHPGRLVAGTLLQLMFSEDGGMTWLELPQPAIRLNRFSIDPANPLLRFAAGESGVFRSLDGGQSWHEIKNGLRTTVGRSVCVDPTNPLNIYASTGQGEFRSVDGGRSWDSIATEIRTSIFSSEPQPARKILIHPADPRIILSARGGSVLRSIQGGRSWSAPRGIDEVVRTLAWGSPQLDQVFAGTGNSNAFWESLDGGQHWFFQGHELRSSIDAVAVDPADFRIVYAGGFEGLFKSSNGGDDWQPLTQGLPGTRIHSIAIDPLMPQTVFVGTAAEGVFKSVDGGQTFTSLPGSTSTIIRSLAIDPQDSQRLWAGSWGEGVFFSSDGGQSWSALNQGLENPFVWEINLNGGSARNLYAATLGGIEVLPLDGPPAAAPFLEARMEVSGSPFAGGLLTYTITLSNSGQAGQADQPEARFVASFSPLVEVIEARSDTGLAVIGPGDNTISWAGTIPAGSQVLIEVRALVQPGTDGRSISSLGLFSMDSDADGSFESSVSSHSPSDPSPGTPTTIVAGESLLDSELLAVPYDLGIESTFVGLALVNFDSPQNGIEYLALNGQGQLEDQRIDESGLVRRGQIPFLTTDIFADPTATLAVRGTQAALSGFFMMGDSDSNRLDGLGEDLTDSQLLYFTEIRSSAETATRLYLFNADPEHESLGTLQLFSVDGLPLGESEVLLAPFGSLQASVEELFGPLLVEDGYIRLDASRPLRGFELLIDADRFAALPARTPSLSDQMWAPHFFWNSQGGTSIVRLLNPGSQAVEASIDLRDNSGEQIAQILKAIPPGQLEVIDVREIPEIALLQSGEGSIEVNFEADSLGPFSVLSPIYASITFDGGELRTLSSLPLLEQPETDTLFLQVAHSEQLGIFQGIAVLNSSQGFVLVNVGVNDPQGETVGFQPLFLFPGQRFVGLLDDPQLFGPGFEQVGGYLRIISDDPLVSYVLFGGPQTLSALQGRPTP